MIEVGRLCYKIAGREAGKPCVIIDVLDDDYVLIDGLVRRKKCNIKHLEITPLKLKLKKKASNDEVIHALVNNHIIEELPEKKTKKSKKGKKKSKKPKKSKKVKKKGKKKSKAKKKSKKVKKSKAKKKGNVSKYFGKNVKPVKKAIKDGKLSNDELKELLEHEKKNKDRVTLKRVIKKVLDGDE